MCAANRGENDGLFLPNLSVFIGADDGLCGKLFVLL